jgi:hypothetical protein
MTIQDLKIYAFNAAAMALNFSQIDIILKIIVSLSVIGYTLHKWFLMIEKNKKDGQAGKEF